MDWPQPLKTIPRENPRFPMSNYIDIGIAGRYRPPSRISRILTAGSGLIY